VDFVVGMHHEDEHAPRLAELERIRSDRYFVLFEGFNKKRKYMYIVLS